MRDVAARQIDIERRGRHLAYGDHVMRIALLPLYVLAIALLVGCSPAGCNPSGPVTDAGAGAQRIQATLSATFDPQDGELELATADRAPIPRFVDPRTPAQIAQTACWGIQDPTHPDGWRCGAAVKKPSIMAAAATQPVIPVSWTVPTWFFGIGGADTNDCTTLATACATFGEIEAIGSARPSPSSSSPRYSRCSLPGRPQEPTSSSLSRTCRTARRRFCGARRATAAPSRRARSRRSNAMRARRDCCKSRTWAQPRPTNSSPTVRVSRTRGSTASRRRRRACLATGARDAHRHRRHSDDRRRQHMGSGRPNHDPDPSEGQPQVVAADRRRRRRRRLERAGLRRRIEGCEVLNSSGTTANASEFPLIGDSAIMAATNTKFDTRLTMGGLHGRGAGQYCLNCNMAALTTTLVESTPEIYAGLFRGTIQVQGGAPILDGDLISHGLISMFASETFFGAVYCDNASGFNVNVGAAMKIQNSFGAFIWGTGPINNIGPNAAVDNSGPSFAANVLTTGALTFNGRTTGCLSRVSTQE